MSKDSEPHPIQRHPLAKKIFWARGSTSLTINHHLLLSSFSNSQIMPIEIFISIPIKKLPQFLAKDSESNGIEVRLIQASHGRDLCNTYSHLILPLSVLQ